MTAQFKYPKFLFLSEWAKFGDKLASGEDRLMFYRAVCNYGLNEAEPELTHVIADFFNTVVRPELDRQHRMFNRRKTRRNGRW